MFTEDLLPGPVRNVGGAPPTGFALDVRLNWYRSLPLSCLVDVKLAVDGRALDGLLLRLYDREVPVDALAAEEDTWWFVLDPAELVAPCHGGLSPGPDDVALSMTLRIPYFGPLPDGRFVTVRDQAIREVVV